MAYDFPSSPTNGQEYTSGGVTFVWNGYGWTIKGTTGGASLTISDTPPASPTTGSLWWESDTGKLWLWYDDGNTTQWVEAAGGTGVSKSYVDAQDATKLPLAGGTLTGDLKINKANAALRLDRPAAGTVAALEGDLNGQPRWVVNLGNADAESGSNAGSNFTILRFSDAGAAIDLPLTINRATGQTVLAGNLSIQKATPLLVLDTVAASQQATVFFSSAGVSKWQLGKNTDDSLFLYDIANAKFAWSIVPNTRFIVNYTENSGSPTTGSLVVMGGLGVAANITAGGGAHQFGPNNTSGSASILYISGGSGAPGGGLLVLSKASGSQWYLGHASSILGSGTSNNLMGWAQGYGIWLNVDYTTGAVNIPSTVASNGASTGALTVGGGAGINGQLSVGPISNGHALLLLGSAANFNANIYFYNGGGIAWSMYNRGSDNTFILGDADQSAGVYIVQNGTVWGGLSDARMKSEIEPVSVSERMRRAAMQFGAFTWKKTGRADIGYTAQDFYRAFPEWVDKGDDEDREIKSIADPGAWGVHEAKAGLAALAYADELRERIEALEAKG